MSREVIITCNLCGKKSTEEPRIEEISFSIQVGTALGRIFAVDACFSCAKQIESDLRGRLAKDDPGLDLVIKQIFALFINS